MFKYSEGEAGVNVRRNLKLIFREKQATELIAYTRKSAARISWIVLRTLRMFVNEHAQMFLSALLPLKHFENGPLLNY